MRRIAILVLAACVGGCVSTTYDKEDAIDLVFLDRPGINERLRQVEPISLALLKTLSAGDLALRVPAVWRVQKVSQDQAEDVIRIALILPTESQGVTIGFRPEPGFISPPMPGLTNQLARYISSPAVFLGAFSNDCAFLMAAYNTTLLDLQHASREEAGKIKALLSVKCCFLLPVQHLATQHLNAFLNVRQSRSGVVGLADLTDSSGQYRGTFFVKCPTTTPNKECQEILLQCLSYSSFSKGRDRTTKPSTATK